MAKQTTIMMVLILMAALAGNVDGQGIRPARPSDEPRINPVGEAPEHQSMSKQPFPDLLIKYGSWPPAMIRYFEAVYTRLSASPEATFGDLAKDPAVQSLARENGVTHFGGPMIGCLDAQKASLWIRTLQPAKVEVLVDVKGGEKRFGPVESTMESDLTAVIPLSGLIPGTVHPYRVLIDGKPIRGTEKTVIVTSPEDTPPARTRIVFGSCFHRWGLGNAKLSEAIQARHPEALVFYGDIAAQDHGNHRGLARGDYFMRDQFLPWRNLVGSLPVYSTWDDHDYLDNDLAGVPAGYLPEDRQRTWEVFRSSWVNPSYGFGRGRQGVFFRTRVGSCDVIMLDTRYFREKGTFLGTDQMKWLEEQLLECRGPFILLTSGTMWSDYVSSGKDSWGVWDPQAREHLFQFIEKNRIRGVLLASGDRHGARGFRIPRPSGHTFYEFEPASLGGRSGPPVSSPEWKQVQLFGYSAIYAFGEFSINASLPDPEVTFRLIREDGRILEELTLTRSQLTPPSGTDR